jgi:hypothetical protein
MVKTSIYFAFICNPLSEVNMIGFSSLYLSAKKKYHIIRIFFYFTTLPHQKTVFVDFGVIIPYFSDLIRLFDVQFVLLILLR